MNNQPGCSTPQNYPTVIVQQPDYSCQSACPTPNRVAPDVQYFDASRDCRISFDVASSSVDRIIIFGLGAIDEANNAFVRDNLFCKVPAAFASAPIINDTDARIQWLSKLFSYNTYVFDRLIFDISSTVDGADQRQFNQRIATYNFTFDPFTGCENNIKGLSCAPCNDGGFNEQVYNSCQIVAGLHSGILIPVAANVALSIDACVCKAGIGENMVGCSNPSQIPSNGGNPFTGQ